MEGISNIASVELNTPNTESPEAPQEVTKNPGIPRGVMQSIIKQTGHKCKAVFTKGPNGELYLDPQVD